MTILRESVISSNRGGEPTTRVYNVARAHVHVQLLTRLRRNVRTNINETLYSTSGYSIRYLITHRAKSVHGERRLLLAMFSIHCLRKCSKTFQINPIEFYEKESDTLRPWKEARRNSTKSNRTTFYVIKSSNVFLSVDLYRSSSPVGKNVRCSGPDHDRCKSRPLVAVNTFDRLLYLVNAKNRSLGGRG